MICSNSSLSRWNAGKAPLVACAALPVAALHRDEMSGQSTGAVEAGQRDLLVRRGEHREVGVLGVVEVLVAQRGDRVG
jgi:hypothetical protein